MGDCRCPWRIFWLLLASALQGVTADPYSISSFNVKWLLFPDSLRPQTPLNPHHSSIEVCEPPVLRASAVRPKPAGLSDDGQACLGLGNPRERDFLPLSAAGSLCRVVACRVDSSRVTCRLNC
jgi:hypothetical protein